MVSHTQRSRSGNSDCTADKENVSRSKRESLKTSASAGSPEVCHSWSQKQASSDGDDTQVWKLLVYHDLELNLGSEVVVGHSRFGKHAVNRNTPTNMTEE